MDNKLTTPQAAPKKNDHPGVWRLVIRDMEDREAFGIKKYGTPLQPGNGRHALTDAYQEILDLAVYVRQEIEERQMARTEALLEAAKMCDEETQRTGCMDCTSTSILAAKFRQMAGKPLGYKEPCAQCADGAVTLCQPGKVYLRGVLISGVADVSSPEKVRDLIGKEVRLWKDGIEAVVGTVVDARMAQAQHPDHSGVEIVAEVDKNKLPGIDGYTASVSMGCAA